MALAGRGWQLAPCLVALFDQADARWPNRSRVSDGSIGDRAHASRTSDHNPSETGYVTAGDLTDDKEAGCDADALAEHLRLTRDRRVKYVIANGRVFRSYGTQAWQWTPYSGSNPHDKHTHISVLDTAEARNDLRPWFPPFGGDSTTTKEEADVPAPGVAIDQHGTWVFMRGTDGHLYGQHNTDGWNDLGGNITSGPTADANFDHLYVVARGTDGAAWLFTMKSKATPEWAGSWQSLGGQS